jgi:hypothetical protein
LAGAGNACRAQDHRTDLENAILQKTNAYRQSKGLSPYKVHPALKEAAQRHALRMAQAETMSHTIGGKSDLALAQQLGYKNAWMGANVAECSPNWPDPAKTMFDSWIKSPPHRQNILGGPYAVKFTDIGVGVWRGKSGTYYASQIFGHRQSEASTINITVVSKAVALQFQLISGDGTSKVFSLANGGSSKQTVQSTKGWPALMVLPGPGHPSMFAIPVFDGQTYTYSWAGPVPQPIIASASPYP